MRVFRHRGLVILLWFVLLVVLYALGTHACKHGIPIGWALLGGAELLGVLVCARLLAWLRRQPARASSAAARKSTRVRFMLLTGLALNVLTLLLLGGMGAPLLLLRPCE